MNRLGAFAPFAGFVLDAIVVLKRPSVRLYVGAMNEKIPSSFIRHDKPIALLIIEPLDSTSRQLYSPRRPHVRKY